MKKTMIAILLVLAACSVALAQPESLPVMTCSGVTTSTTPVSATGQVINAYINALEIKVIPATLTTCTVSVATSGGGLSARTLYSGASAGTVVIRPVEFGSTNGVSAGVYMKDFLVNEALVVSAHTMASTGTSATVTVKPVVERQP